MRKQAVKNNFFLIEILTEELPPKTLQRLAKNFLEEVQIRLTKAELAFSEIQFFVTPRRLALQIKKLAARQPNSTVERKGPSLEAAFDLDGKPTPACVGFARSCGVEPAQLATIKNQQGAWVGFQQAMAGKTAQELLPTIVQQALIALPIAKRMRWGNSTVEFVRPVHSVVMLYGAEIINAEILGKRTGRETQGHRFHSKGKVTITSSARYAKILASKYVLADFSLRAQKIRQQAEDIVKESLGKSAHVLIDEKLLDEVTGLVEWPVAVCGSFEEHFLTVPQEVLISAMQDHQRYFPVVDQHGKLLPHFVAISNIESRDMQRVITGNERVLRARLSDAAFFFEMDKKHNLASRIDGLKNSVFQAKLGSLYDKAQRISQLAIFIANTLSVDSEQAKRAALLSKADLLTDMVGEFPGLQGTAGYYYALHDGEPQAVADAINEQYMPRFSGDSLPETKLGCVLAMADRIDTLIGIFGINQAPTGDKDPFGLRRAALGVLRILIEKKLNLDLKELLQQGLDGYAGRLINHNVIEQVLNFMQERLKFWCQEQATTADVFAAVAALGITKPYDMYRRIQAVQAFKKLPEAESLSVANKRVSNILAKYSNEISAKRIDENLFEHDIEKIMVARLNEKNDLIVLLSQSANYAEILAQLANLRKPVDDFFDKVLVMADDKAVRENRLLMLKKLRELFLRVADIALLQ